MQLIKTGTSRATIVRKVRGRPPAGWSFCPSCRRFVQNWQLRRVIRPGRVCGPIMCAVCAEYAKRVLS